MTLEHFKVSETVYLQLPKVPTLFGPAQKF